MAVTKSGKEHARKIANDESPEIAIATFKKVMDVIIPRMKDESDMYIFTSYQVLEEWMVMTRKYLGQYDFTRKALIVWEKEGPGMGDLGTWGMGSEFILYFKRGSRYRTDTRRGNVIRVPQLRPNELIHPHEKPVQLIDLFIKHSTDRGDFIVDPFGGSGSTVRSAQRLGRSAVAIEYDETNYKKALKKLTEGEGAGIFG